MKPNTRILLKCHFSKVFYYYPHGFSHFSCVQWIHNGLLNITCSNSGGFIQRLGELGKIYSPAQTTAGTQGLWDTPESNKPWNAYWTLYGVLLFLSSVNHQGSPVLSDITMLPFWKLIFADVLWPGRTWVIWNSPKHGVESTCIGWVSLRPALSPSPNASYHMRGSWINKSSSRAIATPLWPANTFPIVHVLLTPEVAIGKNSSSKISLLFYPSRMWNGNALIRKTTVSWWAFLSRTKLIFQPFFCWDLPTSHKVKTHSCNIP